MNIHSSGSIPEQWARTHPPAMLKTAALSAYRVSIAALLATFVWMLTLYWLTFSLIAHYLAEGLRTLLSPTSSRIMVLVRLPVAVLYIVLLKYRNALLTSSLHATQDMRRRYIVNRRWRDGWWVKTVRELSLRFSGRNSRKPLLIEGRYEEL